MFVKGCTAERDQLQLPHAVLEGHSKFVSTDLQSRDVVCVWEKLALEYGEL
jgi:hypothetical protein